MRIIINLRLSDCSIGQSNVGNRRLNVKIYYHLTVKAERYLKIILSIFNGFLKIVANTVNIYINKLEKEFCFE